MQEKLERSLGPWRLTAIVMSAIVGIGIFYQPRRVVEITGSETVSLAAWALGGLIAITGALSFAELGTLFPHTGGQYRVLREAWGRPVGFLYCWSLLTVIQTGAIAIVSLLCVRFLGDAFGGGMTPQVERVVASGVIASLTLLNMLGLRGGAGVAVVTMVLKIAALAALVGIGFFFSPVEPPVERAAALGDGSWSLMMPALIPILFSFGGWQQALYLGGEVREPGRTMPRGIIGGVSLVVVLYLSVSHGLTSLLTVEELVASKAPASDAIGAVFPTGGRAVTALAIAVSAFGWATVAMMTAPRMYKAMADDGVFFRFVGRVHPRFRTPANAILIQGIIAIILVLGAGEKDIDFLTTGVVCIDWIFFLLTGLALFILRRRLPDAERPYRAWGYPVVPALFVIACVAAISAAFLDPGTRSASVVAVFVVVTGMAAYGLFRRFGKT